MAFVLPINTNVTMEAALVEVEDANQSEYRFRVDGRFVKFLHVAPHTFRAPVAARIDPLTVLRHFLPPFPPGDWNHAEICRDERDDSITFASVRKEVMAGVQNLWHARRLLDREFARYGQLRPGVHVCTHPLVNYGHPVLIKYALWPWRLSEVEAETAVYRRLNNTGITPAFLGHLVDGEDLDRVYGIVTEYFPDGRPAAPHDYDGCCKVLARLHNAGVVHRSLSRHSFIVQGAGQDVMLMDFETGTEEWKEEERQEEIDNLPATLHNRNNIDRDGYHYDARLHPIKAAIKIFKW